jgi:hypothetical protein
MWNASRRFVAWLNSMPNTVASYDKHKTVISVTLLAMLGLLLALSVKGRKAEIATVRQVHRAGTWLAAVSLLSSHVICAGNFCFCCLLPVAAALNAVALLRLSYLAFRRVEALSTLVKWSVISVLNCALALGGALLGEKLLSLAWATGSN